MLARFVDHDKRNHVHRTVRLLATDFFGNRTSAKRTSNPFGIRTSETKDLKPCSICTYGKTPRGVPRSLLLPLFAPSAIIFGLMAPRSRAISTLQGTF